MAFSDAAALEEAYRCLVNEMGGLRSTTPNLEEIAGSTAVLWLLAKKQLLRKP